MATMEGIEQAAVKPSVRKPMTPIERLNRLFALVALNPKRLMRYQVGKHHKARTQRAKHRIAKRKDKR